MGGVLVVLCDTGIVIQLRAHHDHLVHQRNIVEVNGSCTSVASQKEQTFVTVQTGSFNLTCSKPGLCAELPG